MITIKVICEPDYDLGTKIRTLFCSESKREGNPLVETNFNELLAGITQRAFNEGREFQKEHPDL